ncbi:NUDIX domain-containing protein [Lacticaseibacillus sp. 866-1]|uniref:NUDIX domain-containing protein n=1 Tax=Lacticaseibacillus sp. 866-1 TaxID=2799576 RepID=UPI001943D9FC|nr:NUDIX domain-containing protein [Lacticaseibacillus sp. 866-1]
MQEDRDIRYLLNPHERFDIRAVLILTHAGQVLVTPRKSGDKEITIVPGGAVKFGETGEDAAKREAKEELGLSLNKLTSTGIVEAFFTLNGICCHQLLLVYQAEVSTDTAAILTNLNVEQFDLPTNTHFAWQAKAAVSASIRPAALGQCLTPGHFKHLVDRR